MAGKIQNQDVKSEAELITGGATKSSLPNDDKLYVNAFSLDKTLRSALLAFDIGSGDAPLRLSANSAGADAKLYFKGNVRKIIDGTSKVASPIDEALGSFVDSNIDFQTGTVTGGSFLYNNASFTLPSTTIGQHRRFAFILQFDGTVAVNYSAAAASVGALAAPETLFAGYSGIVIGYVDLEATAATAFKTSGSATSIIENAVGGTSRIFWFGSSANLGGGTNDFKISAIAANVATVKKGSIILGDGRELMTYNGSTLNTDVSINLKTQVNSAGVTSPAASTAYYLYLDLNALGAATTFGATDREVYAIEQGTSKPFVVLITKPAAVDLTRYVPLTALKTDGSSNYTAYSNLSLRRHQPAGAATPVSEYDAGSYTTAARTINLSNGAQQKFFIEGGTFSNVFPIEFVGGSLDQTYYVRLLFGENTDFRPVALFGDNILLPVDKYVQEVGPFRQVVVEVIKRATHYEAFLVHELDNTAQLFGVTEFFAGKGIGLANTMYASGSRYVFGRNDLGQYGAGTVGPAYGMPDKTPSLSTYSQVEIGVSSVVAIEASTGNAYAWGVARSGQLGNNFQVDTSSPVSIYGSKSFSKMASGGRRTLAIEASTGNLYAWGSNGNSGALGTVDTGSSDRSSPISVSGGRSYSQAASAGSNSGAIEASTGFAFAWGDNSVGQIGDNSTIAKSSPNSVAGARSFTRISVGLNFYAAIEASTGNAYCWGQGTTGQLGDSTILSKSSPVSVFGAKSFKEIRCGGSFVAALEASTGNAYCWGQGTAGQLGDNTVLSKSSPVSVFGAKSFSLLGGTSNTVVAIEGSTGNAYAWGNSALLGNGGSGNTSSPVSVQGGRSFINISSTGPITVGVTTTVAAIEGSTGNAYAWGDNSVGQLGDGTVTTAQSPVSVLGGRSFSAICAEEIVSNAIEASTGIPYGWGNGSAVGQIGNGALDTSTPTSVWGGRSFSRVSIQSSFVVAIEASTGLAYSWGANNVGQLGQGVTNSVLVRSPVAVSGSMSFSEISVGVSSTYAIEASTGNLYAWGLGTSGQLGSEGNASLNTPTSVVGGRSFSVLPKFSGSTFFGAIEGSTGNLYMWGAGTNGVQGTSSATNTSSPVSVFGGRSFSKLAIANSSVIAIEGSTGNAYAWGNSASGQLGSNSIASASSPVSVFGGRSYSSVTAAPSAFFAVEGSTGRVFYTGTELGYTGKIWSTINPNPFRVDPRLYGTRSFSQIITGSTNSFGIDGLTGALYAWGDNSYGNLGDSTVTGRSSPVSVLTGKSYSQVSIGDSHTVALESSTGALYAWGRNAELQLGVNNLNVSSSPLSVFSGKRFSAIIGGGSHFLAIESTTGNAYAWGVNFGSGALGNQSATDSSEPISVFGGRSYSAVSAGPDISLAIEGSTGNVYAWGLGTSGQLGNNNNLSFSSPVSVFGGRSFRAIAAGSSHCVAIEGSTGNAYAWGNNATGSLGNQSATNSSSPVSVFGGRSYSQIANGEDGFTIVIEGTTGNAYGWGTNGNGQLGNHSVNNFSSPVSVFGAKSFSKILGGRSHTVAIEGATGFAYAWGQGTNGQIGNNATNVPFSSPVSVVGARSYSQIGAGGHLCLAIEGATGRAYAWGLGTTGGLGNNTTTSASSPVSVVGGRSFSRVDANYYFAGANTVAAAVEASTGNVYTWGNSNGGLLAASMGMGIPVNQSSPLVVVGDRSFSAIETGASYSVAIERTTGNAYAWGNNSNGQLGDNSITSRTVPTSVVGGRSFSALAAGSSRYIMAIEGSTGNLYAWGDNSQFSLGINSNTSTSSPVSVLGGRSYSKVVCSGFSTCAIEGSTGNAYAWGFNFNGQVGDNSNSVRSSPTSVLGGRSYRNITSNGGGYCAVDGSNGRIFSWGGNSNGEAGVGINTALSVFSPTSIGSRSFSQLFPTTRAFAVMAREGSTGYLYTWGAIRLGDSPADSTSSPVAMKRIAK